jgi:hypothetical protein
MIRLSAVVDEKSRFSMGSIKPIFGVFVAFAIVHSVLASRFAKRRVQTGIGTTYRNGLYRVGFNVLAVLQLVPALIWFRQLPDRTLYRVGPPWSWLLHSVQLLSIGHAVLAARAVGLREITGIASFTALLRGELPPKEPEAQGPVLQNGEMKPAGPFRLSRHPLNLAPIGVFFFFPHMTVNRAALACLSLAYLVLGSIHEEMRLRQAYGDAYRRYQGSGIAFYLPRLRHISRASKHLSTKARKALFQTTSASEASSL